jgi:hypothetical protein
MVHWILPADENLNTDFAWPLCCAHDIKGSATLRDVTIPSTSEASPAAKLVLLIARNEEVLRSVMIWYS